MAQDITKDEILNVFFTSFFIRETSLQESKDLEMRGKIWSKEYI